MPHMVGLLSWSCRMTRMAKRSLATLLIVPSLIGISTVGVLWGADLCTPTKGVLEGSHLIQPEDTWCHVTSSAEVLRHLDIRDQETGDHYSPCLLYNLAKNPNTDCCAITHPTGVIACKEPGWPDDVFEKLIPEQYTANGPLGWPQIKEQICPEGNPGHPFIFVATPLGGSPHTYTVIGFHQDEDLDQKLLYVHGHQTIGAAEEGSSFIDYDNCYAPFGACPAGAYTHDGDYYGFEDQTPPPPTPPINLQIYK